eukprot:TRINITY_DN380_c1_g1_i2.p2 TRINITY_DN380_c1_g1~~TRINITY_DN380_c1_g1_i2.p2  ORF type:complete len:303 (+),score=84.53 TRINITY_DN380_c1_g1_i2:1860-2768(+)
MDGTRSRRKILLLLLLFWIHTLGLLCFLGGFFPLKTPLPGKGSPISEEETRFPSLSSAWKRRVGQVVLILVDALRSDFVFDGPELEGMGVPYEEDFMHKRGSKDDEFRLLGDWGDSSSFPVVKLLSRVSAPTVTLPRVKAITTGSIPGYIDIILNFDSSSISGDSLISQWSSSSRKLLFYGDDTWLHLYPGSFLRSEGTSSFFVRDFTEVDNNVSRILPSELEAEDWDVLALHYLGLDHIGHVVGPGSPLIPSKLREMEGVVREVVGGLQKKSMERWTSSLDNGTWGSRNGGYWRTRRIYGS